MIQFNKLEIDPVNNSLTIDVQIEESDYFKDVYLEAIYIDNQDTARPYEPSHKPLFTKQLDGQELKQITITLPNIMESVRFTEKNVKNDLLFVWVRVNGDPSPLAPCGTDTTLKLGVVLNPLTLCSKGLGHIKEVKEGCNIPKGFIDFLLLKQAFDIACKTGNVAIILKYWNMLQNNIKNTEYQSTVYKSGGCGCGK